MITDTQISRALELLEQNNTLLTAIEHNTHRNTHPGRVKAAEGYTEDFETFWSAYPRKVGKGGAFKAWQKQKPEPIEKVLRLIRKYKSTEWANIETRFIPHPATWLNQRRWEDEPDSKPIQAEKPKCQFCSGEADFMQHGVGHRCSKDECKAKFEAKRRAL